MFEKVKPINAFNQSYPRVLKIAKYQTGEEPKKKLKESLLAGKRVSKNGNIYYEKRMNRSSLPKVVRY